MNRFLLSLAIVASIYGAYDFGKSQGSIKITFRSPSFRPVERYKEIIDQKYCSVYADHFDTMGRLTDSQCIAEVTPVQTVTKSGKMTFDCPSNTNVCTSYTY